MSSPPEPPCHPPAVTEHWVELPVLYSTFLLAIYFTYGNIYVKTYFYEINPEPRDKKGFSKKPPNLSFLWLLPYAIIVNLLLKKVTTNGQVIWSL